MRPGRALLTAAIVVPSLSVAAARPASALPRRNRIAVEVAPLTWGVYDVPRSDGYFSVKGATGLAFYGSYGRVVTRWLELGAGISYAKPYGVSLNMLRPYVFARGFGRFMDNALEFGGALRAGPGFSWLSPYEEALFYAGGTAALTIEIRYWVSKRAGIVAGFEAWYGIFKESTSGQVSPYFEGTTLNAFSLGPTVGFSYRFW